MQQGDLADEHSLSSEDDAGWRDFDVDGAAARAGLVRGEFSFFESFVPIGAECAVSGPSHWVLWNPESRGEKPRDEIRVWAGGAGGDDGAAEWEIFEKAEIRSEGFDGGFVLEFDEQVGLVCCAMEDGRVEGVFETVRRLAGGAGLRREVHCDEVFVIAMAGQEAATGVEASRGIGVKSPGEPEGVRAGEGCVSAEIHFVGWGEPSECEGRVGWVNEGGFGKVEFAGDALHPGFFPW